MTTGGFPLSFAQDQLWFLDQLRSGATEYLLHHALRLRGPLDLAALTAALTEIGARHEVLRTRYDTVDGTAVQLVDEPGPAPLTVTDLTDVPAADQERRLDQLVTTDLRAPFDLRTQPPWRVVVAHLGPDDAALLVAVHHIAFDGWSWGVLAAELTALYGAFAAGEPSPLPAVELQYADYADWQREWWESSAELRDTQLGYWRDRLAGLTPLELPTDRPRPATWDPTGAGVDLEVPAPLARDLAKLGAGAGATPFMVYLAAFGVLLSRYTGSHDIAVGVSVAGRNQVELERLVGCFVNTVVMRTDLSGAPSFAGLLAAVRETTLDAYGHQDVPFERVVAELAPERDLSRNPLFQVGFGLHNWRREPFDLAGLTVSDVPSTWTGSAFDLSLHLVEHDDGRVTGQVLYPVALFDRARIDRLATHYVRLLASAVAAPDTPVSALDFLTDAETARFAAVNETGLPRPSQTLPALFRAQAVRTPGAVAVVADDQETTYATLLSDVDGLADRLAARGVTTGTPVGVALPRGVDLLVALLAILDAGGVYVPLPPDLPAERRAYMAADAGVAMVLDGVRDEIGTVPSAPRPRVDGRDAAYIMYTSGSTGRPKGVMVTHEGIRNRVLWSVEQYGMTAADRVLQKTSLGFDAAMWELLAPLVSGGAVVLAPDGAHRDPAAMARAVAASGVTILQLVPSVLRLLVTVPELACCTTLRVVCSAGEPLPASLCATLRAAVPGADLDIVNTYGPTECSIDATAWTHDPADTAAVVPIGVPLPNTRVYVVDDEDRLAPAGVPGELCLSGVGLARGYVGRGDLTAARFTPNPHGAAGERWYRTGDVVRWREDGALEFLGRADDQVKIRGVRVEPDEVAAALRAHPAVDAAVVTTTRAESGDLELVAYVVPADVPAGELRDHLADRLVAAMVPGTIVGLTELPLSASGKVDRAALPAPDGVAEPAAAFVAPRTPAEEKVAAVFADVLGAGRVGADADFFALGGHSLLAIRLVMRLRREFDVDVTINDLFAQRSVANLAAFVAGDTQAAGDAITVASRGGDLPLSFGQERMWFLDQLEPGSVEYLIPLAVRLRGPFDLLAFRAALDAVVARHEVLRTRYAADGGDPVQVVDPAAPVELTVVDVPEADAVALVDRVSSRPFDLTAERPLRVTVARVAADDHLVALTMHHIAFDVWSMGIFLSDLDTAYRAAAGTPALPPLAVQYADVAVWQREQQASGALAAQLGYWRDRLGDLTPVELPTDRPRPSVRDPRGDLLTVDVPDDVATALATLGNRHGATTFMVLLTAFQVLLGRYTGRTDVAVGTPVAGRTREETEELVGFFVNNLVLRTDLGGAPSFVDLLAQVRQTVLDGFANQDLPFEHLVDALRPERDLSRNPLFGVMFELQHLERLPTALGDAAMELVDTGTPVAKFDLTLSVEQHADGRLRCWFEYATSLFDRTTIERLAGHYLTVLASVAAGPATSIDALDVLPAAERARLLGEWPDPDGTRAAELDPAAGHHLTVPELFERRVRATPDAVAVVYGTEELTYAELNRRVNSLAHHLRALGVGPEVVVASCLERGPHAVVVLLAVLKAGGAYVPFDPNHPAERLGFMLADAGARLVLTTAEFTGRLAGHHVVRVDTEHDGPETNPEPLARPDNLAYMIYTSGSTGRPKGVLIEHRSYAHHCHVIADAYGIGPDDRVVLLSALTFDVAMDQIAATLLAGAAIVVAEPLFWTPAELPARLAEHGVTIVEITPAYYRELLASGDLARLRRLRLMNVGSDVVTAADARRWAESGLPGRFLCNYGPTEATVTCVLHPVSGHLPGTREEATMPLGRPVPGTRAYVVDTDLRLVPAGVPGELCLGGARLARGYHGRPGLTAERFVPDPFGPPGGRLYRTGDLVRHLPDGTLEFLGRIDQQVKVRGFRIELGEVEAALAGHPDVRAVAVVARHVGPGERRLVAHLVPAPGATLDVAALRTHLLDLVPEYMVPAHWVPLTALPLTPSGKVDRAALPDVSTLDGQWGGAEYVAPRTPAEEAVAGIWADVLGVERVGACDDFFSLGGHSLLATRVLARVRQAFAVDLPLRRLFEATTVAGLAAAVSAAVEADVAALSDAEVEELLSREGVR